jgi:hypothetical protein
LELTDEPEQTPKLLIKEDFGRRAYTVFLTDLSSIWKEELELSGIVERATDKESPIEVNENDTTQLPILLQNIQTSLKSVEGSTCRITRGQDDGIVLHTTSSLPEPLDALRWTFYFQKDKSITLKDELITPLLVHSQVQHRKISSLVSIIQEKDRVLTRFLDQYNSLHLDLATTFPSIGGPRSGRKPIRREQAMKHISGLQPFDKARWNESSREIAEDGFSPSEFFREALPSQHVSLSAQLKSGSDDEDWWSSLPKKLDMRTNTSNMVSRSSKKAVVEASEDGMTEDEEYEEAFEVFSLEVRHSKSRC